MFKINDKVQMTCDGAPAWKTGDVGRIVHIDDDLIPYLICFDSNCHEMHHTLSQLHETNNQDIIQYFEEARFTYAKAVRQSFHILKNTSTHDQGIFWTM